MSFLLRLFGLTRKIGGSLCLLVSIFFSIGNAQAVTIDFDDLNTEDFISEDPDQGMIPLTDEYASLGVMFVDGAYPGGTSPNFSRNFVNGPGLSFYFIGRLPQYVSMYVGSLSEYKVGISVYGSNGFLDSFVTDGQVRGMGSDESTPYRHNQFVSFFEPEGIFFIYLAGQADVYMDDLSFGVEVPEPGSWILFCFGLLAICLQRKTI